MSPHTSHLKYLPTFHQNEKWKSLSHARLFATPGLYSPWNSQGQTTGVGSLSLLQGIIPTQGQNPGLLHSRWILYQLSHKGSPRILYWAVYPFSSGSSQPRNWTGSPAKQGDSLPTELSGSLLSKRPQITNVGKDVEKRKPLCIVLGNINWCSH